jgi:hypothetical protein
MILQCIFCVLPNLIKQINHSFFFQDEVSHPILADAFLQLITEFQFIFFEFRFEVFKADRKPVGFHYGGFTQFNQQKIKLQKKDMIFTFTDGFADQFGGEKGKKFKYKNLKNLLLSIYYLPNRQQKEMLSNTFDKWKGDLEQVDDLLLIGLKI